MKCPTCSADLTTGQKFCQSCGANVAALTLPEPPAGPLPFAPPTVAAPLAPLGPPPTDTFAIVEQTVPVQVPTAAPTPAPVTEPIENQPANGSTDSSTHDVPQWVNTWGTPTDAQARYAPTPFDHREFDTDRFSPSQYDQTQYDATQYDATQYDQTQQHHIQAPPVESQLVLGSPTTAVPYPAGYVPNAVSIPGRGSTVLAIVAGLAGVAAIVGAFLPILKITTDAPTADAGDYKLNDLVLGTGMVIGLIVIGACFLAGGVLAALGRRIGAGLAAGAAVALAPLLVVIWGAVDLGSQIAENNAIALAANGGGGTFFRSKQGVGLWILIGAAAVGVIALLIALVQAGADGRPRLNVIVGVGGAVAAVVAAVGQMIPGDLTTFKENFDNSLAPNTIVYGRLAMIALVGVAGAVGFLCSNRWGIGLAVGGASFWVWQWLSSITELGDRPLPPGFVPLGNTDFKPHIVTTIGVVAVLVLAAVALMTAPKKRTLVT